MFERNYKGEVSYSQCLIDINRKPPQAWIDATWPVMKKIETDLIQNFGLLEIEGRVKIIISRVEDPDRLTSAAAPLQQNAVPTR